MYRRISASTSRLSLEAVRWAVTCSYASDAILVGNFACVVVIFFVVLPIRAVVSAWGVPSFALVYLALSLPAGSREVVFWGYRV